MRVFSFLAFLFFSLNGLLGKPVSIGEPLSIQSAHYNAVYRLGRKLYHDQNLSPYIRRSCASCHDRKNIKLLNRLTSREF